MAIFRKTSVTTISGLGLAAVAGFAALITLALDDGSKSDSEIASDENIDHQQTRLDETSDRVDPDRAEPRESNESDEKDDRVASNRPAANENSQSLDFSIGSIKDLYDVRLLGLAEKIESVPGVAEKTKIWIATADVASTPGLETIFHAKGPLTCGRAGCELAVVGIHDGAQKILLETIGESIDAPEMDTLIINRGTDLEVAWKFNGEEFVKK